MRSGIRFSAETVNRASETHVEGNTMFHTPIGYSLDTALESHLGPSRLACFVTRLGLAFCGSVTGTMRIICLSYIVSAYTIK